MAAKFEDMIINETNTSITILNYTTKSSESFPMTISSTAKVVLKPSFVETDGLKQSNVAKPPIPGKDQSTTKAPCFKSYCCSNLNNSSTQDETITNTFYSCQENLENQPDNCKMILSSCKNLSSSICIIQAFNISCQISEICNSDKKPDCPIQTTSPTLNNSTINPTPSTMTTTLSTLTTVVNSTVLTVATDTPTTPTTTATTTTMTPSTTISTF